MQLNGLQSKKKPKRCSEDGEEVISPDGQYLMHQVDCLSAGPLKEVSIAAFSSAALVPKNESQLDETLLINSNDVRTVKSSQET